MIPIEAWPKCSETIFGCTPFDSIKVAWHGEDRGSERGEGRPCRANPSFRAPQGIRLAVTISRTTEEVSIGGR